jgi:predicted short-subunit dehydrogenase-like oxidoreductase (DUF2520 family)
VGYNPEMNKTVSIIGVGRVGGALALALDKCGYDVQNLVSRTLEKADVVSQQLTHKAFITNDLTNLQTEIIFIATQDTEIIKAAENLAENLAGKPIVFHTSGSLSSKVLSVLRKKDCKIASFHPLVSISDSRLGSQLFADAYFCLEGDDEAVNVGKQIVADLGGNAFSIVMKDKPLYHASAVVACGHFVALFSAAIEMLSNCGLDAETSQKILLPLVKSTVENLQSQTPAQALTGTFARTDTETLQRHLDALKDNRELSEIYCLLGKRSLKLAEKQGADLSKIEQMTTILRKAEN